MRFSWRQCREPAIFLREPLPWVAHHRAPGQGVRQRSFRRAEKRDATCEFRAEATYQTGRPARHLRRGRDRRTAKALRAALVQAEKPEPEQRNLLAAAVLNGSEKKLFKMLSAEEPMHIDDIVERLSLNSSEVLAALFDLERKGIIRPLPGKQFSKVLL